MTQSLKEEQFLAGLRQIAEDLNSQVEHAAYHMPESNEKAQHIQSINSKLEAVLHQISEMERMMNQQTTTTRRVVKAKRKNNMTDDSAIMKRNSQQQNDTYWESALTQPLTHANLQTNDVELLKTRILSLEDLVERNSKQMSQMNDKLVLLENNYDEDIVYLKNQLRKYKKIIANYEQSHKDLDEKIDRVTTIIGKLKDLFQARLRVHTDQVLEFVNQREKRIRIDMQENFSIMSSHSAKQILQLHENVDRQWLKQKEYIKSLNENFAQQMDQVVRHVIHAEKEMKASIEQLKIESVMDNMVNTLEFNYVCQDVERKQAFNLSRLGELSLTVSNTTNDISSLAERTRKNERDVDYLCHTVLNEETTPIAAIMESLMTRDIKDRSSEQTIKLGEVQALFENQAKQIAELEKKTKKNKKDLDDLTRSVLQDDRVDKTEDWV